VNPLLSIYAKEIGAQGVMIGVSVTGYWIARLFVEIPSGYISARYGYYRPMLFGLSLLTLGAFLSAFVSNPVQLIFTRGLQGLGAPLFFAISMTFIVNRFSDMRRGAAVGIFQGLEHGGLILGSTFGGFLITLLGFKGGFFLSAILIAGALLLLVFIPNVRREAKAMPSVSRVRFSSMKKVFTNKIVLIVGYVVFAEYVLRIGVIRTVYPLYVNESLGLSLTEIGLVNGSMSIGWVLAMLVMGSVADRIGRKPVFLLGIVGTALIAGVLVSEAVDIEQRGTAIGVYRTFFDLGSVIGPIIMTGIMDIFGISTCFYLASAFLLIAFIISLQIEETHPSTRIIKLGT
jgi:MFS family permease